MRNKNIIMLLISSLILSGCGPEPEDKESQQQQPSTPSDQQVLVAQQAAIKEVEQSAAAAKAAADAKALAQQEVQQYSDKQTPAVMRMCGVSLIKGCYLRQTLCGWRR